MKCKLIFVAFLAFSSIGVARAEKKFSIISDPAGARIEFNGTYVGVTPLEAKLKDHFFNGPKYLWSDFLNEPIQMTVSKEGYVAKTIIITNGPFRWVNLNNTAEKIYYVMKTTSIQVTLDPVGSFLGTNPLATTAPNVTAATPPENSKVKLSAEEIVQKALPAVVTVKAGTSSGSGFFITDTGVIVTNKHVVESSQSVSIITGKGESFQSESIYIHPTKDLALIRIKGENFPFLRLANPSILNVGADVIAMGSPGLPGYSGVLPNTVTKGIVSAFRPTSDFGLLIQTDVSINHGNSGGPLLNTIAEVVGVNTLAFREGGATGINFAISSSEILQMLKENLNFVPPYLNDKAPQNTQTKEPETKSSIEVTSEPSGAEIFVDGVFNSSAPSKIVLSLGEHTIKVVRPGFRSWERKIVVEIGSAKTLNAILEKEINP